MAEDINCDPNTLAMLAKCFKCLSLATHLEVQTYLLCQIVNTIGTGGGGTVNQLIAGSGITLSPSSGVGDVTISATGGGGGTAQLVTYTSGTPANPPNTSLPAVAYDPNGILAFLGWDVATQQWN
jgi:hypothetical protein